MNDTPRTDAAARGLSDAQMVNADFARTLERELAEAKGRIKQMQSDLIRYSTLPPFPTRTQLQGAHDAVCVERDALRAELAYVKLQRDALLEMTWLDLPGDPSESTKRWKEQFEAGWIRRAELEQVRQQNAAMREALEKSGWRPCGCPGHWKHHAGCAIASALSTTTGTGYVRREVAEKAIADYETANLAAIRLREVLEKCVEAMEWMVQHRGQSYSTTCHQINPALTIAREELEKGKTK